MYHSQSLNMKSGQWENPGGSLCKRMCTVPLIENCCLYACF
uniref:Uncharacterized protein n=1 Tax=Anguilla anguilla TaxID=7936 RepID=A0A0E9R195_ANGAN